MRRRLNLIIHVIYDFNWAVNFHENGIDWKKSSSGVEELALFPLDGIVLALQPRTALAVDAVVNSAGSRFSGVILYYNARNEKGLYSVLEKVKSLEAIIVKSRQKVYWRGNSACFHDLNGHLFEEVYNPFWELDENILKLR